MSYNFEDDIWVFESAKGENFKFKFDLFLDNAPFVKKYVDLLLKKKELKYISIYKRYKTILSFFKYIGFKISITEVHTFHIEEYLEDSNENEHYNAVFYLYEFFSLYKSVISRYTLNLLEAQKDSFNKKENHGHFKLLPREFINSFIQLCFTEIRNEKNSNDTRLMFSLLLLQSQIGLRISELINLEITDLIGPLNPNVGNVLRYKIYKGVSEEKQYKQAETFMNPIALKAFCKCIQLSKVNRNDGNKKIFIPKNKICYDLNNFLRIICKNHYKFLRTKNNLCYNSNMNILSSGKDLYCYPTVHQFRVFRINWLLDHNVPIEKIQKTVGHEKEYTTCSYARTEDVEQEKIKRLVYGQYSKETLDNLVYLANKQYEEKCETTNPIKLVNGFCHKKNCGLRKNFIKEDNYESK